MYNITVKKVSVFVSHHHNEISHYFEAPALRFVQIPL